MTGVLILFVVVLAVFAYTYVYHRDRMSNWMSYVGTAASGIMAVLGAFDVHALLPYVNGDWRVFAAVAGMFLLVGIARNIKAE